ncbi:hypothetical protein LZ30DRAFT_197946 [Colletotrichum cereale]|nr:hypothetical protein LZ30DRAFT_197946 [Colletotrichum cereale]
MHASCLFVNIIWARHGTSATLCTLVLFFGICVPDPPISESRQEWQEYLVRASCCLTVESDDIRHDMVPRTHRGREGTRERLAVVGRKVVRVVVPAHRGRLDCAVTGTGRKEGKKERKKERPPFGFEGIRGGK